MTIAVISMIRDSWGGSEELWYEMAKTALKNGYTVIHLRYETPELHPKMQELIKNGLIAYTRPGWFPHNVHQTKRIYYLGKNYLRKKIDNSFQNILKHNPNVIIYNGTCYSIAAEKKLNKLLSDKRFDKIPFYIVAHLNSDFKKDITDKESNVIKTMYNKAKKVLFVSKRSKEIAQRHLCSKIENGQIIRNPVNLKSPDSLPFPSITKIVKFALVGNLVTVHKGQDILIEVLSKEEWRTKEWELNIYGSGYDEKYLKDLVKYHCLDSKIKFHGKVSDIRRIWEENHMLIMPSHMEGMPLAVVEAMLCGRPCLATDVGGHCEWIDDNINGFISEGNNVSAINKTLRRAWGKRCDWEGLGKSAHKKAASLYEKNAGKKLLEVISNS